MEFLFCGIIQILRNLDLNGYILITADGRVLHGNNAFSSQADLGTGLHTFPDLTDNISVKGGNGGFTAENSGCVRNRNGGINIRSLSFIARTCSYGNLQKKVTRLTAAGSGHAFSFQTDTLAGINTCRNMNLKCLRCTGASVRTGQRDPFICTKSCLIKGNVDAGLYIRAFLRKILLMESDEPAEPGVLGRFVISDLLYYAFPILRYDNGDTAVATRKEKNGRYRLYLDELYGRRSDLIYDCEGKAITPYIITNNLWDIEGVRQYRFIQEDVKDYTIWLNGDPQKMNQEEILGRIRPYLGEEARIRVELVDEIPVLASGKRKYIENRCEKYKNQTGFCG